MINTLTLLEINQPIGTFYIGKINSRELIKIKKVVRRRTDNGPQRDLEESRVKGISRYCEDPDATFPTPIVLAVNSSDIVEMNLIENTEGLFSFKYDNDHEFAEILDGQHRVEGISLNGGFETDLMIVIMIDLTMEEKAYVFSTINSNQKKVDKSIIYDLFEVSENRSPAKTCHAVARSLNSMESSAFYNRLKMLGKKEGNLQTLSQGTFVTKMLQLISKDPQGDMIASKQGKKLEKDEKFVLRQFFIDERDDIITKILMNYFNAVANVFDKEWESTDYILVKTTGFGALIKVFPAIYIEGSRRQMLTQQFFESVFRTVKNELERLELELTSADLGAGEQAQARLASIILSGLESWKLNN